MSESEKREGGFLRAWSRRKIEAQRHEEAPVEPPAAPAFEAPIPEEAPDPELIASLPSIDEITAGFDIKPFLAKGVPASLKNAALRRLWSVSPSVSLYSDPAVDYAWDWNAPGGVPGGGGILSDHSVAKMVKDLIGNRPETDETSVAEEIYPAPADPADETQVRGSDTVAEPAAVRLSAAAELTHTPASEPASALQAEPKVPKLNAPEPAPRRHGGAVPD